MLSVEEARKKGIDRCIEIFGKEFCEINEYDAGGGFCFKDDVVICNFGFIPESRNVSRETEKLSLTEETYQYSVSIEVDRKSGETKILSLEK